MYNTLEFTDRAARDEEWAKVRATGARGVVRYTTHAANEPQIIYILAYPTVSNLPQCKPSTEVPLTGALASGNLDTGGNNHDSQTISSVAEGDDPQKGSNPS